MKLIFTLKAIHPLLKLLIWTLILGSVGYLVTENPLHFDDITCRTILYDTAGFIVIFLLISSSQYLKSGSNISGRELLFLFVPRLLAYLTTVMLMLGESFKYYEINFWVCLISWIILFYQNSCIGSLGESIGDCVQEFSNALWGKNKETQIQPREKESTIEFIILALSAAWSIASIFITLGTTVFQYGNHPIHKLLEIHKLLDLRINLAIIVGVLIAFKSMVTVIQTKVIEIKQPFNPKAKKAQTTESNKTLDILTNGFISFINLGISFLASLGNVFYKIFAIIFVYFYFIGGEIFNSVATLLKKSINLIFYIFIFSSIITIFYFSFQASVPILAYLRGNTFNESLYPLLWSFIFTISISICLITINYFSTIRYSFRKHELQRDEKEYNEKLIQVMQTLPILVFSFLIIGILLFSLSKITALKFFYFKSIGIISAFLTIIILVGFIIYLFNNFSKKENSPNTADKNN